MKTRRDFLKTIGLALVLPAIAGAQARKQQKLNILLFTADDLNCDSVGCFGGEVQGITPHIDHFASQGMLFKRAHVTVAICAPSRGVLASGLYGHNSGMMGFMKTQKPIPTIMESMRNAGYLTGVLGKVSHSTPKEDYEWDFVYDYQDLGAGRSPEKYYGYCKEFFEKCRRENKPFYFMVNSHDPHRPFHDPDKPLKKASEPSRIYKPDQVKIPGFLPDLPGVRKELCHYFNSVRRCDDTFGKTIQALEESGMAENTLVMFLSDNGIAMPFAKANVYLASTRTPWIVRWPGVIKPGTVNADEFISGIDFFPTVIDAAKLSVSARLDGKSFVPLLKGEKQSGRDMVFTQIDWKIGGPATPMRCLQNARYGYIYNAWSDGKFSYKNNNEGQTMKAMEQAAKDDPAIAQRINVYRHRTPEEFYDMKNDPDFLDNLIDKPAFQKQIKTMRMELEKWMRITSDPLLDAYLKRDKPVEFTEAYQRTYAKKPGKTP
jgi:N-sulfoglucosamine sulfohydrolase